jgi:hypothetical protein
MTQSGINTSAEPLLEGQDLDQQFLYVKTLIQKLKEDNQDSLKKELFGEDESNRTLDKKQIKELFRLLRKLERDFKDCCTAPIPPELEGSIRGRDESQWLPWELEAIEKVEVWRAEIQAKRQQSRLILDAALHKLRSGQKAS